MEGTIFGAIGYKSRQHLLLNLKSNSYFLKATAFVPILYSF
jgi:hypothetical protein